MYGSWALIALAGALLLAKDAPDKEKTPAEALVIQPARTIEFTTDEGTWMSVDVSPDGKNLLVDLLGDVYTLPAEGGELKPLTSGMAWDCQPRYSPDGMRIVFVSDRNGSDNLWLMNADGSDPKALTKEKKFLYGSPAWSPDGQYIVARRWGSYPLESFLRKSELWLFHKDGGSGVQLTKGDAKHTRVSGPVFSPDGKYIYFSAMAGRFQYNSDLGKWQVQRLSRETGEIDTLTSEYGGGLRPMLTPDGRGLLYATRHDSITGLRIRNLETRAERWLSRAITRDDQEGFSAEDTLPGYAVARDGKYAYLTIDGKLHRLGLTGDGDRSVPFTAHVKRELGKLVKFEDRISDTPFSVKQMRWMHSTPDGRRIVFGAVGKLWVSDNGGPPRRLTSSRDREYWPALSTDGRWLAYVTWNDRDGGRLWKLSMSGGNPVELSRAPAFYSAPVWSPDGSRIAYLAASSSGWLAEDSSEIFEVRVMPSAGGASEFVTQFRSANSSVVWSGDGKRLFYNETQPAPASGSERATTSALMSIRTDGVDKRVHVKFNDMSQAVPSPDQQWMLVVRNANAWLVALPQAGTPATLNLDSPSVPVRQLTSAGALYPTWMPDGSAFTWSFANRLYRIGRDEALRTEKPGDLKPSLTELSLTVPRNMPQGRLALRNVRIVTMKGDQVIERGDILIENGRIAAAGLSGSVSIPGDAHQMDLAGKTVIPGFVDIHAHLRAPGDVFPDKLWPYAANLAYGVTTTRDPSTDSNRVFPYSEMVEAGEILGPRIYSTGTAMTTTAVRIESLDDARAAVKRYKDQGANYLKQYMQPRRLQRQWILQAAAEIGINVTAEGGGFLKENIAMIVDGYTGVEHSLPVKIHKDVIELVARSGTVYTPTLIVSYGGWFGQHYWRQRKNYHADEKLATFTPHDELDRKTRRRRLLLDEEYFFPEMARGATEILRRGGRLALGSHGEQQGIGAHWELWMLGMGGMTPHEALRVATLSGAAALGLDEDLGSIEAGKLADLLVLDGNPIENLRYSESIQYVIKGGEVFQGATLDRVWPSERKLDKFYWRED